MHLDRASALLELGRAADALSELGRAGADADLPRGLTIRTRALLDLVRIDEARVSARLLRAADPCHETGYRLGAVAELADNRRGDAARLAEQAVTVEPNSPEAHAIVALVMVSLGDLERAEASVLHMQRLAAQDILTHITHAKVLLARGKGLAAEAAARRALTIDPHDGEALGLLADAVTMERGHEFGVPLRLNALRADPQNRSERGKLLGGNAPAVLLAVVLCVLIRAAISPGGFPKLWRDIQAAPVWARWTVGLAGYAYTFGVWVWDRGKARTQMPAHVWASLKAERRNGELLWIALPAALLLPITSAHLLVVALLGRASAQALAWAGVPLFLVAGCWSLRSGAARELSAQRLVSNIASLLRRPSQRRVARRSPVG
jgi:tetratricopeptide (TPR) repeat protein